MSCKWSTVAAAAVHRLRLPTPENTNTTTTSHENSHTGNTIEVGVAAEHGHLSDVASFSNLCSATSAPRSSKWVVVRDSRLQTVSCDERANLHHHLIKSFLQSSLAWTACYKSSCSKLMLEAHQLLPHLSSRICKKVCSHRFFLKHISVHHTTVWSNHFVLVSALPTAPLHCCLIHF